MVKLAPNGHNLIRMQRNVVDDHDGPLTAADFGMAESMDGEAVPQQRSATGTNLFTDAAYVPSFFRYTIWQFLILNNLIRSMRKRINVLLFCINFDLFLRELLFILPLCIRVCGVGD